MTDVIFLLLIFFMITSTLIVPTAMEVNLPQSADTVTLRPVSEVYIDSLGQYYFVTDRNDSIAANREPRQVTRKELTAFLQLVHTQDSTRPVALYADRDVHYGTVVSLLDDASRQGVKMVLATQPNDE